VFSSPIFDAHTICLTQAEDHTWEKLTVGVENARGALQDSLDDAISTFDGKHRADLFSRKVVKLRDRKL
jgi:hypothetical protein